MTDDKGAGEGPYRVVQPVDMIPLTVEGPTGNHGLMLQGEFLCNALNAAHTAGRKAERARCLEIARGYSSCEGIAQKIAKEIEEAQDGK